MVHLTAENFAIETRDGELPAAVMFYAGWCGKCGVMKPVFERLDEKYWGEIRFCTVDVEESEALAAEYEAKLLPTFVTFRDGEVFSVMRGVIEETVFEQRIRELL